MVNILTFLIMAGGSGERFWPLSTKENPKQVLKIFNEHSLLRLTYLRVLPISGNDSIFVATNEIQLPLVKKEIPELKDENIIIEPAFKDTASAILYSSMIINKYFSNRTICVLASDHLIGYEDHFRKILLDASKIAFENKIVTIGLKPTYPETGYGYIKVDNIILDKACKALEFKEKPSYEVAKMYLEENKYLWNSGMFIFNYNTLFESFKKHAPKHFNIINKISQIVDKNEGILTLNKTKDLFMQFDKISIDYAIMEHEDNIVVIPCDIRWNDVGSFSALYNILEPDCNNNYIKNVNVVSLDSNNNIIVSNKTDYTVNLINVHDMIIVISNNDILILNKDSSQDIKKILQMKKGGLK